MYTYKVNEDYWEVHEQDWLDYIESIEYSLDNKVHDWA